MILKTFIDSINCGKKRDIKGNIKINSHANIVDVKPIIKKDTNSKSTINEYNAIVFFEHITTYILDDSEIAGIKIRGRVIYEKGTEDIIKTWTTDKKIDKKIIIPILNNILAKASVTALINATQINLPPPFQLPNVKTKELDSHYID
ncbi:MAG: hypothetical protein K0B02_00995 [DPANN group archaeon]|nr:hypothetical protein [DPANN group archaeon]